MHTHSAHLFPRWRRVITLFFCNAILFNSACSDSEPKTPPSDTTDTTTQPSDTTDTTTQPSDTTDATTQPSDTTDPCPPDFEAAEGTPCSPNGTSCNTGCEGCTPCWILSCEDGVWVAIEAFPPPNCGDAGPTDTTEPPNDTGATADVDTTADCSNDSDCEAAQFCDFPYNDCGVWGTTGTCAAKPETCVSGGPGACGCQGQLATNDCELNGAGTDVLQYGGCQIGGESGHRCGEKLCDAASEYCTIGFNDVAGPNEPMFFANCVAIPDGCGPDVTPDCSCVPGQDLGTCYDSTGLIMVFIPGG